MTDEWLDFIIDCRSGKPHQYDIVIGTMANDQIYNYVSDYIDGAITREQFWVLAKFKYPTTTGKRKAERQRLILYMFTY